MKKSINGFFLAETIIMIALVTTVVAFLYPNVSKLYENYNNRTKIYDQVEDIYTLKAVYDYLEKNNIIKEITKAGCENFNGTNNDADNIEEITDNEIKINGLTKLYITGYMSSPSVPDDYKFNKYEFNKYLKRMKKTTYDTSSYRLIGVFKNDSENSEIRYASIKILNPNPSRNCEVSS